MAARKTKLNDFQSRKQF